MRLSAENKLLLLFGSGLLLLLTASYLGWFGVPSVLNGKIEQFKRLDNNMTFETWKKVPVPLDFKVYLFNVTNPESVLTGHLPELKETGPYVYQEYISKELLDSSDTKYFRYMKRSTFKFNAEKSNGLKDTDVVTVINLPLMGIALFLERNMPLGLDMLETVIPHIFPGKNKLFLTDTVANLLFDGVTLRCPEEAAMFCMAMNSKPLQSIKMNEATGDMSFAFFRHKNGTLGPYEVDKGLSDVRNVGQIMSYKGDNVFNIWVPNSTCDAIRGTDSTIFAPFIPPGQPIHVFEPDICISGTADYVGEEVYQGIPVSRFVGSRSNFAEEGTNCRCPREDYSDPSSQIDCLSPGLIDLTPCQGAPVIASQPHFYQGNDMLRFSSALKADPKKHQTFSLIDRLTGVPLKGRKMLQLNIQMKPIEDVSLLENVTEIIFPVLWVEEGIELEGEILSPLVKLHRIITVVNVAKWVLVAIALVLVGLGIAYYIYRRNFKSGDCSLSEQPSQTVLFNKVTRNDGLGLYSKNQMDSTQISPNSFIRERMNGDNDYAMKLESSLYPSTLDPRNLERAS